MRPLTARQTEVLAAIAGHVARLGRPPTVRGLAALLGVAGSTARGHLAALERRGRIERDPRTACGIRLLEAAGPTVTIEGGRVHVYAAGSLAAVAAMGLAGELHLASLNLEGASSPGATADGTP